MVEETVKKLECTTYTFSILKHVYSDIGKYVFVNNCEQCLIRIKKTEEEINYDQLSSEVPNNSSEEKKDVWWMYYAG